MKLFGYEIRRAKPPATRFLGDILKVELSPGDVCVLMVRTPMSREATETVTQMWRATVGDDVTLVVLDDGMKIGVLSPPHARAVQERIDDAETVERTIAQ